MYTNIDINTTNINIRLRAIKYLVVKYVYYIYDYYCDWIYYNNNTKFYWIIIEILNLIESKNIMADNHVY